MIMRQAGRDGNYPTLGRRDDEWAIGYKYPLNQGKKTLLLTPDVTQCPIVS